MTGRRRFFSGSSESQAAIEAAAALGVPVAELLYRAVDKRGGLRPGRTVIEVDPDNPRRPAGAALDAAAAAPAASPARAPGPSVPHPPSPRAPESREWQGRDREWRDAEPRDREPRRPVEEIVLDTVGREAAAPFAGEDGAAAAAGALAALAGLELAATVERRGDEIHVDLGGPAAAALTVRQGELLRSFEYLLRRVVRDLPEGGLVADSGGFRADREEALRRRAAAAAEEVRRGGEAVLFEPLGAAERRVVHLAIQDETGVASASEGDGETKRLRVFRAP
jgi:hypothetical protein